MNILQDIFKDHYEEMKYTLHPRDTEMENIDKIISCGDPPLAEPCMAIPTAEGLNLSLSAATAASAPPAVTFMPCSAPFPCPLN